jgi:hypothetical protein
MGILVSRSVGGSFETEDTSTVRCLLLSSFGLRVNLDAIIGTADSDDDDDVGGTL